MASLNARLIEKDILTDVPEDEAGTSEIVDLNGASKFSCQLVYVVDTPVGATATFQASEDGVNWTAIQAATSISADGSTFLEQANVSYRYFRVSKALVSGTVDLKALVLVIGDAV
jgi:hypothetical protein